MVILIDFNNYTGLFVLRALALRVFVGERAYVRSPAVHLHG